MPVDFSKCVFISYARENLDNSGGEGEPIDQTGVVKFLVENRVNVLVDNPHLFKRAEKASRDSGGFLHGLEINRHWTDSIDQALHNCPVVLYFVTNKYLSKFEKVQNERSGQFGWSEYGRVVRRELLMARGKRIFVLAETAPNFALVERACAEEELLKLCFDEMRGKHCYIFDRKRPEGGLDTSYLRQAENLLSKLRQEVGERQLDVPAEPNLDKRLSLLDRESQADVLFAGSSETAFALSYRERTSRVEKFLEGIDLRLRRRRSRSSSLGQASVVQPEQPIQPYFDNDPITLTSDQIATKIHRDSLRNHLEPSGKFPELAGGLLVPVTLNLNQKSFNAADLAARTILKLRSIAHDAALNSGSVDADATVQFVFLCKEPERRRREKSQETDVIIRLGQLLGHRSTANLSRALEVDIILPALGAVELGDVQNWITAWTDGEHKRRTMVDSAFGPNRLGFLGRRKYEMDGLVKRLQRIAHVNPQLIEGWGKIRE